MRASLLLATFLCGLAACAEGLADSELVFEGGENDPTAARPRDAGTDSGRPTTPDAGMSFRADAGSGDGGVAMVECKGTSSCPVPIVSGNVSGDKGADTLSITGATSGWYSIRVTENDSGFSGRKLKLKVTLTSPASSNYDLFLYENAPADCTTAWRSSTQSSGADTAAASWGEGSVANGDADDKDVYIEVRHVSGTCNASSTWSLQIEGNTN